MVGLVLSIWTVTVCACSTLPALSMLQYETVWVPSAVRLTVVPVCWGPPSTRVVRGVDAGQGVVRRQRDVDAAVDPAAGGRHVGVRRGLVDLDRLAGGVRGVAGHVGDVAEAVWPVPSVLTAPCRPGMSPARPESASSATSLA